MLYFEIMKKTFISLIIKESYQEILILYSQILEFSLGRITNLKSASEKNENSTIFDRILMFKDKKGKKVNNI